MDSTGGRTDYLGTGFERALVVSKTLFSSKTGEHPTPQDFFDRINDEFELTFDAAATPENAKCDHFVTKETDALQVPWFGRVWLNPPYGRGMAEWLAKARSELQKGNVQIVVILIPARTDTQWFHDWVWDKEWNRPQEGVEIRFEKGRLRFGDAAAPAPFPSMLVIMTPIPDNT